MEPTYPAAAAESRIEGNVGVELTIGRDGRVADARITSSRPGLDEAALAAVRQWEFAPVVVRGAAVPVIYHVTVPFTAPAAAKPAPSEPAAPVTKPAAPASPPVAPPAAAPVTNTAKPTPPPPAPEPKGVDLAAEESAVRSVLSQYQAAWESRDAEAVGRLQRLSSGALDRVRETLESAAEYSMTIGVKSVTVEPDGRRARATASVARRFRPRVGRAQTIPAVTSTFTLEKREGRWVITDIR